MKKLRNTLDDILEAVDDILGTTLDAVRDALPSRYPSLPITDQEKLQVSNLIKRVEAEAADQPAYTAEEWHDKFVKPLLETRPASGTKRRTNSVHPPS